MTYHHKIAVASLITSVIVYVIYAFTVLPMNFQGRFDGPEGARTLGWAVLILIAVAIAANILAAILFNIMHAIVTREPKPSFIVDERDRHFEARGTSTYLCFAGTGFMIAVLAMALGAALFYVIHIILLGFVLGDFASNIMRHRLYLQGN